MADWTGWELIGDPVEGVALGPHQFEVRISRPDGLIGVETRFVSAAAELADANLAGVLSAPAAWRLAEQLVEGVGALAGDAAIAELEELRRVGEVLVPLANRARLDDVDDAFTPPTHGGAHPPNGMGAAAREDPSCD